MKINAYSYKFCKNSKTEKSQIEKKKLFEDKRSERTKFAIILQILLTNKSKLEEKWEKN